MNNRREFLRLGAGAALGTVWLGASGFVRDGGATAKPIRMVGSFVWNNGGTRPERLEATMTELEDGSWKAVFRFRFNGSRHRWEGTLEGDPIGGAVSGIVSQRRGRGRTWEVEGRVIDGKLQATHAERTRRGLRPSGTLTLSKIG